MANYVDRIVAELRPVIGDCDPDLLRIYALLVLTTGESTTTRNVHDAWSVWRTATNPDHRSLLPFDLLTQDVKALDLPYVHAIVAVARQRADAERGTS